MSAVAPSGNMPPQFVAALQAAQAGAANASPGPSSASTTQGDGDWEQDLIAAIAALRELEGDAEDHQEASVIATCIAQLRKLTAQRQAGAESALGVTPAHKAMARAY